jgi:hypothetical protein
MPRNKRLNKKIDIESIESEEKEVPIRQAHTINIVHSTPVVVDGLEVISILSIDKESCTCKMSNGETKLIPRKLFIEEDK